MRDGGGGTHFVPYFTDEEMMQPFAVFIDWCRTYTLIVGEHRFTFFDIVTFCLLVGLVFWFVCWIADMN